MKKQINKIHPVACVTKYVLFIVTLLFASCEKLDFKPIDDGTREIKLQIAQIEQMSFANAKTRAASNLTDVCNRINILVYDEEGSRVINITQKADAPDFGTASFRLPQGEYSLVVLAHSSNGNPTSTDRTKINFPNNYGVTDTFRYYDEITIGADNKSLDLTLKRCVAMVRFVFTDDQIPENIKSLRFKYTGGSSTLNAASGLGNVKSTQDEQRLISSATINSEGHHIFEIYTFPHAIDSSMLKITVSSLGENGDEALFERVFDEIPISTNQITQITTKYFDTPSISNTLSFNIDAEWESTNEYEYIW